MSLIKRGILLCTILLLTSACSSLNESSGPSYHGLLQYEYQSLEDALERTESIVEVRKTGKVENLVDQRVDLTLTEVEVLDMYKGDRAMIGHKIRILDLMQTSMGLHEKEDHYVLFLYPKTGRLGTDIYAVLGEYQGKFKVSSENKIIYDADHFGGVKTFQAEMENLSLLNMSRLLTKS